MPAPDSRSAARGLPAELRPFDWNRHVLAEPVDELFLIDDDDKASVRRPTIFSRNSAPPRPLIRSSVFAVPRRRHRSRGRSGIFGEARERNAEPAVPNDGVLGGRNGNHSEPRVTREAAARRRSRQSARAETDDHPASRRILPRVERRRASGIAIQAQSLATQ